MNPEIIPISVDLPDSNGSKFVFRQDFGRKTSRQQITWAVASKASRLYPERSNEECFATGKKFADAYGTFMGAVRSGFLAPFAIDWEVDGVEMRLAVERPDDTGLSSYGS